MSGDPLVDTLLDHHDMGELFVEGRRLYALHAPIMRSAMRYTPDWDELRVEDRLAWYAVAVDVLDRIAAARNP